MKQIFHHVTVAGLWFRYWTCHTCLTRPLTLASNWGSIGGCSYWRWHVALLSLARSPLHERVWTRIKRRSVFFNLCDIFYLRLVKQREAIERFTQTKLFLREKKPHAHISFHFPAPFSSSLLSVAAGIGYSMFSHGTLNRALEMKSPPPLNQASENMRGDAATQALGVTRANCSSAVSSYWLAVWSI